MRDYLLYTKNYTNDRLRILVDNYDSHTRRYEESLANYDPFKAQILKAISQGLGALGDQEAFS